MDSIQKQIDAMSTSTGEGKRSCDPRPTSLDILKALQLSIEKEQLAQEQEREEQKEDKKHMLDALVATAGTIANSLKK